LIASAPLADTEEVLVGGAMGSATGVELSEFGVMEHGAPKVTELSYSVYRIRAGDTLSKIAEACRLNVDTLISYNDIKAARSIPVGMYLKIPNQDGIVYTTKEGDTTQSIANAHGIVPELFLAVNELKPGVVEAGRTLFLPGALLPNLNLREINGELFRWPVRGHISSYFGWRPDPFTGVRDFHNAIDIVAPMGTPVLAGMEGRVSACGYHSTLGNYVFVEHHSGFKSIYCHLSRIDVKAGQYLSLGQRLGAVGSTGYSTGSHLHFGVYKWGRAINPLPYLNL
jgi:murein DD-endopeptidase MepM/ murein hydrolase activator NlpD